MADHEPIDRYGIGFVLPVEARLIHDWVAGQLELWTQIAEHPEGAPGEEYAGVAIKGIEFLLDYAREELRESVAEFEAVRGFVTSSVEDARAEREARRQIRCRPEEISGDQARERANVRATLRGYLQEVVHVAQEFGLETELPQLLDDVTNPKPTADLVSFDQLRLNRARAGLRGGAKRE